MLRKWLITNTSKKKKKKKQTASDLAENLAESSAIDVPTKIVASLSKEDQQQANELHYQHHRKEILVGYDDLASFIDEKTAKVL